MGKDICPVRAIIPYLVNRAPYLCLRMVNTWLGNGLLRWLHLPSRVPVSMTDGTTRTVSGLGQQLQPRKQAFQTCVLKCWGDGRVVHISYMFTPLGTSFQDFLNKWWNRKCHFVRVVLLVIDTWREMFHLSMASHFEGGPGLKITPPIIWYVT